GGERYYQKDTPRYAPSWIRTVAIPAPSAKREVAYTVCNDTSTLAWLGNQAALEFHPAPVRRDRLERPDLLTVDIDPPDDAFDARGGGGPVGPRGDRRPPTDDARHDLGQEGPAGRHADQATRITGGASARRNRAAADRRGATPRSGDRCIQEGSPRRQGHAGSVAE